MPTPEAKRVELSRAQLPHAFERCSDPPPTRHGKVRDIYQRGDEMLIVTSDRVSAFDVVVGTVPFKGAMLTEQATFWLSLAADVMPTHLLARPHAQAMVVRRAEPLAVEMVVRGHLAGSLMREPKETRGAAYGLRIDPAVPDYGRLERPVVTPTTKAALGAHDQPVSLDQLAASGVVSRRHLDEAVEKALALFDLGEKHAARHGLLLVDTKYEMGLIDGELVLIDEIHTADSSRYWIAASYEARLGAGEPPEMIDKERLRRWLRDERGYGGEGSPPPLTDEVRIDLAQHYWFLTEQVTGRDFRPTPGPVADGVRAIARRFLRV